MKVTQKKSVKDKKETFSLSLFLSRLSPEKLKLAAALLRRLPCPFEAVAGGPHCVSFSFSASLFISVVFSFSLRLGLGLV